MAAARRDPGAVSFGTTGVGTYAHLGMLALERQAGISLTAVAYGSTAPMRAALLQGGLQVGGLSMTDATQEMAAGTLRPLGQMAAERWAGTPDVPTLREQGFDVVLSSLRGFAAPAGTPPAIIQRLSDLIGEAARDPGFRALAEKQAMPIGYQDSAAFAAGIAAMRAEYEKVWRSSPGANGIEAGLASRAERRVHSSCTRPREDMTHAPAPPRADRRLARAAGRRRPRPAGLHARAEEIELPAGWETRFIRYATLDNPTRKIVRNFYVNPEAFAAAKPGVPLPDGTLIILADNKARLGADGTPLLDQQGRLIPEPGWAAIGVQEKRAGWGGATRRRSATASGSMPGSSAMAGATTPASRPASPATSRPGRTRISPSNSWDYVQARE